MKHLSLQNEYENLFIIYRDLLERFNLNNRGFVYQYDEDEQDCELLFLGMNPSYTVKHELKSDNPQYEGYYTRSTDRGYFKPFGLIHDELLRACPTTYKNWTHIDLFVFRETNQKVVEGIMRDHVGPSFLLDQLIIAKNRIAHIQPKVIVVNNALAREFTGFNRGGEGENEYGVWMGYTFEFDDVFGSYRITNDENLKNTHVLFTSMLSGQRALDLGSRERLVWQIKRILKNQSI